MNHPMRNMLTLLGVIVVGGLGGAATFYASPETQQSLRELPWWTGALVGLLLAVICSTIGVATILRRR